MFSVVLIVCLIDKMCESYSISSLFSVNFDIKLHRYFKYNHIYYTFDFKVHGKGKIFENNFMSEIWSFELIIYQLVLK